MTFEHILFSIEDGVALLSLNRPEQLNSFNTPMHLEVREALKQVRQSKDARVLLLTGEGRGFCAGQDLSDRNVAPGADMPDLGESIDKFYNPLVRTLRDLPLPVICAVNGVAAGAGAVVVEFDRVAGLRGHLGDTCAHGACTDHGHLGVAVECAHAQRPLNAGVRLFMKALTPSR